MNTRSGVPEMDYWLQGGLPTLVALPEAPGTRGLTDRRYGPEVGGYAGNEFEHHEAPVAWGEAAEGAWSDGWWPEPTRDVWPDYSIGGTQGTVTATPYSIGPVDPSNVENMELTGRILVPGREPEFAPGPVGSMAYRSDLIMQIVQAMGPEVTDEMAQVGLLSGL